ncbi:hypothetical protein [Paraburkholderia kururiensis]|uniref:Uncharacterized protein n=1 Tax=Paraburkholderia kururiensis TaxID=984307 RepID=A0ABZ0WQ70_9BURK|nr:hypothetical protein [Paraburkholderia kururiensis]WQD79498.1 hypothetical protein U0042_07335 [Paraburkholderia kururiensis]
MADSIRSGLSRYGAFVPDPAALVESPEALATPGAPSVPALPADLTALAQKRSRLPSDDVSQAAAAVVPGESREAHATPTRTATWNGARFRVKPEESAVPALSPPDAAPVQGKLLCGVRTEERPAFDALRSQADDTRVALRKVLRDRGLAANTTLLPFVFKHADGSYRLGMAGNSKAALDLLSDEQVKPLVAGHVVVPMQKGADAPSFPRSRYDKLDETTAHHAEQQALRWADDREDVQGIAYFAPTAHVCEGCLQSIYERAYDPASRAFAFDPDETISPHARAPEFFRKETLPAWLVPGGRERAVNALQPAADGTKPSLKNVARHFGVSPRTLARWSKERSDNGNEPS